ncbi:MAG: hypothetical protein M9949_14350 [Candidatus Kapabacteria bacterium]|nr:hypothetical protein [Candidatus Kapabacteria bacterium]
MMSEELNNEYGPREDESEVDEVVVDAEDIIEIGSDMDKALMQESPDDKKSTVVIGIVHEFSAQELVELAQQITEIDAEIDSLLGEQLETNEVLKKIKKRITGKDDMRRELSKQYVQGFTTNLIDCTVEQDYDNRLINFIDEFGTVVKSEPIPEDKLL